MALDIDYLVSEGNTGKPYFKADSPESPQKNLKGAKHDFKNQPVATFWE